MQDSVTYIISENEDGSFTVQTPNPWGGLYPLVMNRDQVRSIVECMKRIGEHWLNSDFPRPVDIKYRWQREDS